MEEPRSPRPSQDKRPGRLASLGQKTGTSALSNLAIFAILPLVLLGGLLAGLIASGVLTLKPSSDGAGVLGALLLGPAGVVITGKDDVELRSADGLVTVSIPAGAVTSPITLEFQESGPAETPRLPPGFLNTGRSFQLSARPSDAGDGPVEFQQMISIAMGIGPNELALAGNDYSRFFIQHFLSEPMYWEVLPTTANLLESTVMAKISSLSQFALTFGPSADFDVRPEPGSDGPLSSAATSIPSATLPSEPTQVSPADATPLDAPTAASLSTSVPMPTPSLTPTAVPTQAPSPVPTATAIPVPTPTALPTPTLVPTPAPTPSMSPPATPTPVPTPTATPVPTATPIPTPVPTPTATPVSTATPIPTPAPTAAPPPTSTPAPTAIPAPTATPFPTPTPTPPPYISGGRIAFQSDRSGNLEVMITGLDRANPVNLTNHLASDMDPCWCGNENLAFVSDRDGDLNIYMMSADGASQTRLTDSPGADFAPSCVGNQQKCPTFAGCQQVLPYLPY